MERIVRDEAKKIWLEIAHNKTPGDLHLEIELYKKMLNIFQVGDFHYFIFNPPTMTIEFCSESLTDNLGDRKSTRSELQSLMRISYAVFCLKKQTTTYSLIHRTHTQS